MDREAWWAIFHRVAKSQTWLKWLSAHTHTFKSQVELSAEAWTQRPGRNQHSWNRGEGKEYSLTISFLYMNKVLLAQGKYPPPAGGVRVCMTLLLQRLAVSLDQTHWTLMWATPPSNKSCVIAPLCLPLTQGSGLKLCSTLESSKQLLKCQQLGCLQTGWIRISGVRPRLHSVVYKVPRWFECFPKTLRQTIQLWGFPKSSFLALVLLQLIPSFPETLRHSPSDQSSHLT